jgi:phage terminase large subunit
MQTTIDLNLFQPRDYQRELWDAINNRELYGFNKFLAIWPRRSGKDILGFNAAIRQCLIKTCTVFYCLPTYSLGKKCIFDAIAIDGQKFISFAHEAVVESINQSEMKIVFRNGSILIIVGTENYDRILRGVNPYAIILSEAAYMDLENIYSVCSPILAANGGWMLVQSTPKSKNGFWSLYQMAIQHDNWYVSRLKTDDIKHIPLEALAEEKRTMSEAMFEQEYNTSFDYCIDEAIYGTSLMKAELDGRITQVPWDPQLLVHVAIDIGLSKNNATTMIFYQCNSAQTVIRIIDCYSNVGLGLDHYAKYLQEKPYRYGKYFAPHDLQVREWGAGAVTRYERGIQYGINFKILDKINPEEGIDHVLVTFPLLYFDAVKCKSLLTALEAYRRERDEAKKIYTKPIHDWSSNYADALRYLCQSLAYTKEGMSAQDFERARSQAIFGRRNDLPGIFSQGEDFRGRF